MKNIMIKEFVPYKLKTGLGHTWKLIERIIVKDFVMLYYILHWGFFIHVNMVSNTYVKVKYLF